MNPFHRFYLVIAVIWLLLLALLIMSSCGTQLETSPAPQIMMIVVTPAGMDGQATLAAAQTQEKIYADNQAAATAEIIRANAQATLNSADATLSAAQTQQQNSADVIAAQMAADAELVRADAQATLNAANSTQSAALTQDAIQRTQAQEQQNRDLIAAGTQTAVADHIATQTQSAVETSQWYTAQSRLRVEQRQGPMAFLWTWCLPVLIVLFAGLCLWGFWRWLKIKQNNQRIIEQPVEKSQERFLPSESEIVDDRYGVTNPDEQMGGWMDEIKRKLINREKDSDDNPDG